MTTQKGEREEALEAERFSKLRAYALLNAGGELVGVFPHKFAPDAGHHLIEMAPLISSSKAEGEMREALEKRAAACPECKGVGKILVSFVSQHDGHVADTRTACPSCHDIRAALTPKDPAP